MASTSREDLKHWADEIFLHSAKAGSLLLIKSPLMLHVSPHILDGERQTALMYAALDGHSDIVQLMLDLGVSINIYDRNCWSPLMLAAWNGHVPSPSGITALMAVTTGDHTALVSLFFGYGAEVEAIKQSGAPPGPGNWSRLYGHCAVTTHRRGKSNRSRCIWLDSTQGSGVEQSARYGDPLAHCLRCHTWDIREEYA